MTDSLRGSTASATMRSEVPSGPAKVHETGDWANARWENNTAMHRHSLLNSCEWRDAIGRTVTGYSPRGDHDWKAVTSDTIAGHIKVDLINTDKAGSQHR